MKYTHILWDFNGTILNDVAIGAAATSLLLQKYKNTSITVEDYRAEFGFPVVDYYDAIGLERENYPKYAVEWFKEYLKMEPTTDCYDGVRELLAYFKAQGKAQYLVSASESATLAKQIARLGISEYFTEQVGSIDVEAHGKIDAAIAWAKREKPACALFIGDSLHDFEVATAIGAECVLLGYGHQAKERLLPLGCPVFDGARELLAALENGEVG